MPSIQANMISGLFKLISGNKMLDKTQLQTHRNRNHKIIVAGTGLSFKN